MTSPAGGRTGRRSTALCLIALVLSLPLSAQVPGSALDKMLQRPKVAKHFENKRFGDRLFLEGGVGLNSAITNSSSHIESPGFNASVAIGDWVTPLHGWRLGIQGGSFKYNDKSPSAFGVSADYLLNITALSQSTLRDSTYANIKPFEVYGVAGIEYYRSSLDGVSNNAAGLHLGLRGQLRLSDYTYLYVEPRLGVYSDGLFHDDTWRGYRFAGSLMAGLGYRLNPGMATGSDYTTSGHFLDDTFFALTGGPSALVKKDGGSLSDYFGARAGIYLGKWLNPYSGLRIGVNAALYKQAGENRVKALGVSAGYLWNMHNTFIGYDPDRRFWINAVADVGFNASGSGEGRKMTPSVGAGLQTNFRIARGIDFYLEPRIDIFGKDYACYVAQSSDFDAAASLMAGFTFHQNLDSRSQLARNDDFVQETPYDNIFVEAAIGGALPVTKRTFSHAFSYLRPKAFVGIGKWFTATSGVRLWGEGVQYEMREKDRVKALGVGIDYLWNITNAFHGYLPDRRFELVGAVGVSASTRSNSRRVFPGLNAGLKGIWHANKMWALFIEPQLRCYSSDYLPRTTTSWIKQDMTAALVAGLQVNLRGYSPEANREIFEETERKSFFSIAGGVYTPFSSLRKRTSYGAVGRVSYGRWFSPVAAWRVSMNGLANPRYRHRYAQLTLGGDYMVDLSALGYGYDEDRIVILRALAGLNLGVDYGSRKSHFAADIHAGGQLAFRTGRAIELFAEPQVGYRLDRRYGQRGQRVVPQLVLGLNYRLRNPEGEKSAPAEQKHFASFAIGSGLHSSTVASMQYVRRKLTLDFDLSYGQWFTAASGWRVGLSDVTIQRHGRGNQHITALHGNYLRNLLSSTGQSAAEAAGFRLTGIIGITANLGTRKGYSPTWGLGLEAGFQAGWMVSRQMELYLEPM